MSYIASDLIKAWKQALLPKFRRYVLQKKIQFLGDQVSQVKHLGFNFLLFKNDRISNDIINGKIWENHISILIETFCKPNMVAIDCGANFGLFTLQMAKCVGDQGKVIAFETQNLISQQLNFNVFTNGFKNVSIFRNAVWSNSNEKLFMEEMDTTAALVNIGAAKIVQNSSSPILSLALDDLLLARCDFMKIDIQGSEVDCLIGATNMLTKLRPIFVIEVENDHLKSLNRSDNELLNLILSNKYRVGRILNEYPADHLCIPEEKFPLVRAELSDLPFQIDWIDGSRILIREEYNLYRKYEILEN